MMAGT